MPPKGASDDLKARVPVLYHEGYSVKDICYLLGIKKTLVYKVLNWYLLFGNVSNPYKYSCSVARPRALSPVDLTFISAVVNHRPSVYLDELQDELRLKRNIHTTLPTLSRALKQLGVTRKAISARASERNELSRALYMNRIAEEVPDPNMLVFVDEAARDERTISRRYGRSGRGFRCTVRRQFVRGTRYSIIPAITLDGIIAYDIVEGPVDTERFVKFLREQVVRSRQFLLVSLIDKLETDAVYHPLSWPPQRACNG